MYNHLRTACADGQKELLEKEPELRAIFNLLEKEGSRFHSTLTDITARLNQIYQYGEPQPDPSSQPKNEPTDAISAIKKELSLLRSLNDRLEFVSRHISQLV